MSAETTFKDRNATASAARPPIYVGIDVGERFAVGMTEFQRHENPELDFRKTLTINMRALNRPKRTFLNRLEMKKRMAASDQNNVFQLERDMQLVQPNQRL